MNLHDKVLQFRPWNEQELRDREVRLRWRVVKRIYAKLCAKVQEMSE